MARGVFDWEDFRNMVTGDGETPIWHLTDNSHQNDITLKTDFYSEAIQPNDLSLEKRGWADLDHKYTICLTFSATTEFQFELGIDIFTVDLQLFRYYHYDPQQQKRFEAFGYNMIVFPVVVSDAQWQQNPDRRISRAYFYNRKTTCNTGELTCARWEYPTSNYNVNMFFGPSTSHEECNNINSHEPYGLVYEGVAGLSPQEPTCTPADGCKCSSNFQNVTIRGISNVEAGSVNPFAFVGTIVMQFELENGEHPTVNLKPHLWTTAISTTGTFSGSTSTCRTAINWPVNPTVAWNIPDAWDICEEVDARTFGPHDWAVIMFDIKDVDRSLTLATKLEVSYVQAGVPIKALFVCRGPCQQATTPNLGWLNFHELTHADMARKLDNHPKAPRKMDFGFLWTPGAINENLKITITCTIRILTQPSAQRRNRALRGDSGRRFEELEDKTGSENVEGQLNFELNVDPRMTPSMRNTDMQAYLAEARALNDASTQGGAKKKAGSGTDGDTYVVPMVVTALICTVVIAGAAVGSVWYVRRHTSKQGVSKSASEMAIQ